MKHTPRQKRIPGDSARPLPFRGLLMEFTRWVGLSYLTLLRWKLRGDWPRDIKKFVLVAAPHTSNWDGLAMLSMASYYRASVKWMGKKSLTTGLFGWLIKMIGCVPVDRTKSTSLVEQMAEAFSKHDKMCLLVPPEGTRGKVKEWKSGFYHIAVAAKVPIVLSALDYGTKSGGIIGVFHPTGDYEADLPKIMAYYSDVKGKYPENHPNYKAIAEGVR